MQSTYFGITWAASLGLVGAITATMAGLSAQQTDKPRFYWVVENSNRVMLDESQQDRFDYEMCRALDCSRKRASHPTFPFCDNILGVHADKARRRALISGKASATYAQEGQYCSDRYKQDEYWEPLPSAPGRMVKTAWNAKTLRYERADGYVSGKARTISAWLPNAKDETCSWKLVGVDADFLRGSCHETKRQVEIGRTYELRLRISRISDSPIEVSRAVRVDDVFLVTLGDSYSSGEGNPHSLRNFKSTHGLDTWWDRRCHRSLMGYSSLAVSIASMLDQHFGDAIKHSFTYMNFACSGAEIKGEKPGDGGLITRYEGRETLAQLKTLKRKFPRADLSDAYGDPLLPAQIKQLQDNLCPGGTFPCPDYRKPDYITLTIGGNDVGFGPLIREYIKGCTENDGRCPSELLDQRFKKLKSHFDELAQQINAIGVKKHVLLIEYLDLTRNEDRRYCNDFSMRRTLGPKYVDLLWGWLRIRPTAVGYGVDAESSERVYKDVLKRLNDLLREVAEKDKNQNWLYVSGVARKSEIRGWCAQPSWFIRFDDSNAKQGTLPDTDNPNQLSDQLTTGIAHPNIFGHNFINWRIRCQLELDGILPPGSTQEDGKTPVKSCE